MIDENSTKAEVLESVKQYRCALKYASAELRGDREVVLAAVQDYWGALRYAGDDLLSEVADCWEDAIEEGLTN